MTIRTQVTTTTGLARVKADVLIVPVHATGKDKKTVLTEAVKVLNSKLHKRIADAFTTTDFAGNLGQTFWIDGVSGVTPRRVLLLGVGAKADLTAESLRRAAGTAALATKVVHGQSVAVCIDDVVDSLTPEIVAQSIAEGFELALYKFLKYKKEDEKQWKKAVAKTLTLVTVAKTQERALKVGVSAARMNIDATVYARDLINEPAVHMTPTSLSAAAKAIAKEYADIRVTVMDEAQARKLGMGSFLSVAAGSDQEAQFIHLVYTPKKSTARKTAPKKLVVCGKGITFDSGGISIKPSPSMNEMKMDMSGAAAVLGLFTQISKLAPNLEVHGVIPATENMPSGKATKPGDIVTALDGTTIEVTNTDAEGRLVLADAMAWSVKNLKPDYMVDLATLTGAAIYAVGQEVAPFYSTSETLTEYFEAAYTQSGESMWEFPLVADYKPLLKSAVADLDNSPATNWAGSIIGALFLQHFAKTTPWIHVDIAGPAMAGKQILPYAPTGGTGFGVRTLIALVSHIAQSQKA